MMSADFWYGFGSGIAAVFVLCAIIVSAKTDLVQRSNSRFFIALNARKRRRTVRKLNSV